jgi:hypothetical protein
MEDLDDFPILRIKTKKRQPVVVKVQRSPEEWQKIIEDAKRKEVFWTKGIVPGVSDAARHSGDEEFDEE